MNKKKGERDPKGPPTHFVEPLCGGVRGAVTNESELELLEIGVTGARFDNHLISIR